MANNDRRDAREPQTFDVVSSTEHGLKLCDKCQCYVDSLVLVDEDHFDHDVYWCPDCLREALEQVTGQRVVLVDPQADPVDMAVDVLANLATPEESLRYARDAWVRLRTERGSTRYAAEAAYNVINSMRRALVGSAVRYRALRDESEVSDG